MNLSREDDSLHAPVGDDPYWSETHWFSFDQPGPNLSATIYPVFRTNFEIALWGPKTRSRGLPAVFVLNAAEDRMRDHTGCAGRSQWSAGSERRPERRCGRPPL